MYTGKPFGKHRRPRRRWDVKVKVNLKGLWR
jgi:hypothetical protein